VGIPVRINLPGVGANLADHPALTMDIGYRAPMRDTPVLHCIATFYSDGRSRDETPDLMLWLADGPALPFEIEIVLLRPYSRGAVRLRSSDPSDSPVIVLPNLEDSADVRRLAQAYERAVDVVNKPVLRRLCSESAGPVPMGDDISDLVRSNAYSLPHVVGTCAMGPRPELGAVVDAEGRVHGTEQLSIVDASIMRDVPSGFTHIPTIMIAELLSERIASQL
jgi:choline dehydrogenase